MRCRPVYPIASVILVGACQAPPPCGGRLSDACRKAEDLVHALGIQLADEASDGNAILGDVNAMGATGLASVSMRVTRMQRNGVRFEGVPIRTDGIKGESRFDSDPDVATAISLDGVVGAWHGSPLFGGLRFGGVDLVGNVTMATNADRGNLHISASQPTYAVGVRLGLIEETRAVPAISLTSMFRFPRSFSVTTPSLPADSGGTVQIEIDDAVATSLDYRLAASKKFGPLGVSSGIGHNLNFAWGNYRVTGTGDLGSGVESASFHMARVDAFVGATYTIKRYTFGAELGRVMGGEPPPMQNVYGERGDAARNYLTFGVRIPAGRTLDKR
jgi:hypothetical protein